MLTAEVISIGDEILIGDIVDTNSNHIAKKLFQLSCTINCITQIRDRAADITKAVRAALERSDIVILTGGLGPTNDDITKSTLAAFFASRLELRQDLLEEITLFFRKRDRYMSDANKEQAEFPHNALPIRNSLGTAPGIHYKIGSKKHLFSLPGVPFEMEKMVDDYILPLLAAINDFFIRKLDIHTSGIGESHIYSLLDVEKLQHVVKLGFLPRAAGVVIRISAEGRDLADIMKRLAEAKEMIKKELAAYITGYDDDTPALTLLERLKEKKYKVSFAESCTGGLIASTLTDLSGASEVFKESYVTYANESKYRMLAVSPFTLEVNGAVSTETVEEMLEGLIAESTADIVGAVSGIAGPAGGSAEKPVGTVYVGCRLRSGKTIVERYNFTGNRTYIKAKTVNAIFRQMIKLLSR